MMGQEASRQGPLRALMAAARALEERVEQRGRGGGAVRVSGGVAAGGRVACVCVCVYV